MPWPRLEGAIVVGVVNNMPDPALRATERQYRTLLAAAANGRQVHLRLFSLPEIPRGEAALAYIAEHYEGIDQLWGGRLDGLIVTGSEPRAPFLEDEPYWPGLAKLTDWSEGHTLSTVWSCLAAQAAVLRADGIVRRPFGWKLSGVFQSVKAGDHDLTAELPTGWRVPQTRHNDLPEDALASCGYRILSRLPDAGADMFMREGRSLSLFLQGHPEYDPASLCLEYRRDVARYLAGERDAYPDMLQGYFDTRTEAALEAFRARAMRMRDPALLEHLADALTEWTPVHDWHAPAVQLYANWFRCLERKREHAAFTPEHAMPRMPCPAALGAVPPSSLQAVQL